MPPSALLRYWGGAQDRSFSQFGEREAEGSTTAHPAANPVGYPSANGYYGSIDNERIVMREPLGREGGCAIAVMAKAPRPGAVKTRLAPPLALETASALSAGFLRDITENIALAAGT